MTVSGTDLHLGSVTTTGTNRGFGHTGYTYIPRLDSYQYPLDELRLTAGGLMLIAIAGVATWMIALYSSHRIAGPLYRFSQNLKLAAASDAAPMLELRKGDALLAQAANVKLAVTSLRDHYGAVRAASAQAMAALAAGDAANYADAVQRLKGLDDQVQL